MAGDMATESAWKKMLNESNAFGWIAFFILVIGFGVGTILFGLGDEPKSKLEAMSQTLEPGRLK
jgi:hypothetical protein